MGLSEPASEPGPRFSSGRSGPFLTAEWRDLVLLNYAVDPDLLRPYLPERTELDSWHGSTFVSLVAFRFLDTRVRDVAIPWHRDFEEVNLRFYVRRPAPDGTRRGVVFVKEIVPRRAIAWVARAVYGERYVALPMRHQVSRPNEHLASAGRVEYAWRSDGRWNRLAASTAGVAELPPEGSEESLVTEHYWGYTQRRGGGTLEYRVEHPPWRVWRATSSELECDVAGLYGSAFAPYLDGPPHSAFVADGSPVTVWPGARIA